MSSFKVFRHNLVFPPFFLPSDPIMKYYSTLFLEDYMTFLKDSNNLGSFLEHLFFLLPYFVSLLSPTSCVLTAVSVHLCTFPLKICRVSHTCNLVSVYASILWGLSDVFVDFYKVLYLCSTYFVRHCYKRRYLECEKIWPICEYTYR